MAAQNTGSVDSALDPAAIAGWLGVVAGAGGWISSFTIPGQRIYVRSRIR